MRRSLSDMLTRLSRDDVLIIQISEVDCLRARSWSRAPFCENLVRYNGTW
jgi:hypothetical protein